MATPASSVREYCTLLSKSRLLTPEEAESLRQKWQAETGGADSEVEAFGKYLVGKRIVTLWQSAMLQRGRADGFFLEGFKILDQIGKGQMGGVYKAVHSLGQTVALKILPASRARDPRVLGRFQREARLLTLLDHPNVVRAVQVGESGGRHFIAMEFLEGETLDEILNRRKRLPVAEAVRLARQALDGLQHLLDRRTVHRDLKPSNLMIVPAPPKGGPDTTLEGTVKILDIGLGREMFTESDSGEQAATQLTVEGVVVGTPDYMSPEQAKDARSSDIRADIYSLGCVLYHCLTGRPPFTDSNIMTQMLKHATEKPEPVASFLPDAPASLQNVLDRMMAKQPGDRYQTPDEAAEALRSLEPAGSAPARGEMLPAYRQWLESESVFDAASPAAPQSTATAGKPGTGPNVSAGSIEKTGTGKHAPISPAKPAPPVVTSPGAPANSPHAAATPQYSAPQVGPTRPGGGKVAGSPTAALSLDEEVEVELVTLPIPVAPAPIQAAAEPVADERSLLEPNRRDLIMLIGGGMGVLGALGLGYGLARLARALKSSPPDSGTEEKKE